MKNLYFITGSQDLYGEDTLAQVDIDSRAIWIISITLKDTVRINGCP